MRSAIRHRLAKHVGAGAAALLAAVLVVSQYRDRVRNRWRADAVARVARLANDADWVAAEIAALRAQPTSEDGTGAGWISDDLVLLQDGSWVVYANICSKSNWRIDDLFVGRDSDGRWYQSTYHFCTGALVLRGQGRPPDLASFRRDYVLVEFDGRAKQPSP